MPRRATGRRAVSEIPLLDDPDSLIKTDEGLYRLPSALWTVPPARWRRILPVSGGSNGRRREMARKRDSIS